MKPNLRRHLAYALFQTFNTKPFTVLYDYDTKKHYYFKLNKTKKPAGFYDFHSQSYLMIRRKTDTLYYVHLASNTTIAIAINGAFVFSGNIAGEKAGIKGVIRDTTVSLFDASLNRYFHYTIRR